MVERRYKTNWERELKRLSPRNLEFFVLCYANIMANLLEHEVSKNPFIPHGNHSIYRI